ncbi:MAG: ABC transporter ATP-binding protein [Clostridia bacterium]
MLTVRGVSYQYPDGVSALNQITFTILGSESVGLIGENGAGKSTLLSLLCGLLMPTSGQIAYDSIRLQKDTLKKIRESVGMVFQNPDDQLFMPTIYDDVAFGLRNEGLDEVTVRARVMHTLHHLGIEHLADRPPYRLSGGEKRSAAIATVVAMKPGILFFDEPTAFLDAKSKRNLIQLLPSINAGKLIVTHDLDLVEATCSRVLVLQKGRLLRDGPTKSILSDKAFLAEAGL